MITFEEFKKIFDSVPGEPEFEIKFKDTTSEYMIIKYDGSVSFPKCGHLNGDVESSYPDLDTLYKANSIDNICLSESWDKIEYIVVNGNCYIEEIDELELMIAAYDEARKLSDHKITNKQRR